MKKVALSVSLTYVVLGVFASCLILSLPWNETSRVICLILSSFVFSSAALMALVWALQATWSTAQRPACWNRLATLAKKEKEIQTRAMSQTSSYPPSWTDLDIWEDLREREVALYEKQYPSWYPTATTTKGESSCLN